MAQEWYYTSNKQQLGPVTWEELRQLATSGLLRPNDLVWREGLPEWVKAARQEGLFPESAVSAATGAPSRRRPARRRDEDDVADEEEDDRPRRKPRKEGMAVGLKVGLILGGVLLLLFVLVCGGIATVWVFWPQPARRPVAVRPPVIRPVAPPPGIAPNVARKENYTANVPRGATNIRVVRANQGQRVVVTVQSDVTEPNTDVDLRVTRSGNIPVANAAGPGANPNLEFVAPLTTFYQVRLDNRGPGQANCRVMIDIQ